jgi:hypothetical protein
MLVWKINEYVDLLYSSFAALECNLMLDSSTDITDESKEIHYTKFRL